jgi:hypothetical protein
VLQLQQRLAYGRHVCYSHTVCVRSNALLAVMIVTVRDALQLQQACDAVVSMCAGGIRRVCDPVLPWRPQWSRFERAAVAVSV